MIKRQWNTPGKSLFRSRNAEISKLIIFQESEHLISSCLGQNIRGISFNMPDNTLLISGHQEEIILFGNLLDRPLAVRTSAVLNFFFCPETFIRHAVPPCIKPLFYLAFFEEILKQCLDYFYMSRVCRPDEGIVLNAEFVPCPLIILYHRVCMGFRCHAFFLCCLFNFLAVFISSCQEENFIALQPVVSCEDISSHSCVGMPDMRHIIDII